MADTPPGAAQRLEHPESADLPAVRGRGRIVAALSAAWGAVMGLAPHVLHHVGPLVGTAVVAGTGGTVVFGVIGFLATIPTLRSLHRRFGTWRAPVIALVLFVALFAVTSFVIGPLISGTGAPPGPDPLDHDTHHG